MHGHLASDSHVMGEINVTPLVDVMLVLLIIFMIVTPAIVAGFKAQLPVGVNLLERPDDENRTTLGIDADGGYYLNKRPVAREEVLTQLQSEFARHPQDRVLFVQADRSLKYGEMLAAMDLARQAGARVIAAVTDQQPAAAAGPRERR